MKKVYQQPLTSSFEVQPQSILCASPGRKGPNLGWGGGTYDGPGF